MPNHIDLRLFATLAAHLPRSPERFPVSPGATIRDILHGLGIPEDDVKIAFVNSVQVSLDTPVRDGDRVGLFPPIGGG